MNPQSTETFKALLRGVILLLGFALAGQAAAQTWTQLTPTGGPPAFRCFGASTVYDPSTNRMIIFAGANCAASGRRNDVWALSNANGLGGPPVWTNLIAEGAAGSPPDRVNHSAVYDSTNNRMIIFGGCEGGCLPTGNDVWVLTNANGLGGTPTWTQLFPSGTPPAARQGHRAVYDPASNRMIITGGQDGGGGLGSEVFLDTWVLTNANGLGGTPAWTQLSPTGGPPSGYLSYVVYDSTNNRMTLFGGQTQTAGVLSNAIWVLSNANGLGGPPVWTNLIAEGAAGSPSDRCCGVAVNDVANNRMTIFFGAGVPTTFDTWVLFHANGLGGTTSWTQLSTSGGPPGNPAGGDVAGFDPATNRMIVFSSCITSGCTTNEVWVLTDANGIMSFAAFTVKVDFTLSTLPNNDTFDMKATFTLGTGSDGIAPLTEDVTIQIGTFSATIPAGPFTLATPKKKPSFFTFTGPIGTGTLSVRISPLGGANYQFQATGSGLSLAGVATPPITVGLTIGDDSGRATAQ